MEFGENKKNGGRARGAYVCWTIALWVSGADREASDSLVHKKNFLNVFSGMKAFMTKLAPLLLLFLVISKPTFAQLDSVHWIPPMYANDANGTSFLYISTPEQTPFSVELSNLSGGFITSLTVSNSNPAVFQVSNNLASTIVVDNTGELGIPLNGKGFKLQAAKKFYANYRVIVGSGPDHAGSLTAKGIEAPGKAFRIGHFPTVNDNFDKSNFFGLSALENNTQVVISGLPNGTVLANGSVFNGNIPLTLNAGQSYILAVINGDNPGNPNALMGALVSANKPVVVNCGSWLSSPSTSTLNDIGIDQIVPADKVGNEYILLKGFGSSLLETPIVVAHQSGTQVFINGGASPFATLNAGDFVVIPASQYSPQGNMYVRTNKPVFVYQQVGGSLNNATGALNFIPPLSCQIGKVIDNIPNIRYIGNEQFTSGGIFIIAVAGAWVQVLDDGTSIPLPSPQAVLGNADYVTYRIEDLDGNIKVSSEGPIQVAVVNKDGHAGWSGYFSGFTKVLSPQVAITTSPLPDIPMNNPCPDTLFVHTQNVGDLFWYKDGATINPPNDTVFPLTQNGNYMVVGELLNVCNEAVYDTAWITIDHFYSITAQTTSSTCSGNDGTITVDAGAAISPQYSIDGIHFQAEAFFGNLSAGTYTVIVRDANGCTSSKVAVINSAASQPQISSLQITPEYCGQHNASLVVNVTNGTPPYLFSVTGVPDQGSGLFTDLVTGTYGITVTDNQGCKQTNSVVIPNIPAPEISEIAYTDSTSCGKNNGSIEVKTISYGTPPFLYEITGMNAQTGSAFYALPPGLYQVIITDSVGCQGSYEIEIAGSAAPVIQAISLDSASCHLANGSLLITAEGGQSPLEYGGTSIPFQSSNELQQLPPGDFLAIVQDLYGCRDSLLVSIPAIPPPSAEAAVTSTTCGQANGGIVLSGEGGSGVLKYSLDGIFYTGQNDFWDLAAGDYTVYLLDGANCQTSLLVPIPGSESLKIDEIIMDLVECGEKNGSLEILVSGGEGDRLYSINQYDYRAGNQFKGLAEGVYQIRVRDEGGCADSTLVSLDNDCVFIPNVFSPNNDGVNDLFQIFSKENASFEILRFEIFDRWGDLVYCLENQNINNPTGWWDGTYRGKELMPAAYTYSVVINTGDPVLLRRQGTVTIIR